MAHGKYLSLEEARRAKKLGRFAKEYLIGDSSNTPIIKFRLL